MKRHLMILFTALCTCACVVTVFLWWNGNGDGVIFPFIGRLYCEVECINGSMDLSVTRYHATPLIIREKESVSAFLHRGTSELISDFSPPHGVEYYSRGVSVSSRLFEWFDFKRTSSPDPDGWSY